MAGRKLEKSGHDFANKKTVRWLQDTFVWKLMMVLARHLYDIILFPTAFRPFIKKNRDLRKTVFILINTVSGGGAERVASVLASELSECYHVFLFYRTNKGNNYPISPSVETVQLPMTHFRSKWAFAFAVRYLKALKKAKQTYATVSLLYYQNALNVASKVNDTVICCERNNPTKNTDADHFDNVVEIYEKADYVVFQSAMVMGLFNERIKGHGIILPNPVGISCRRNDHPGHRIVNCGRLVKQKNQTMLIRSFARFHKQHPEYSLSIYGEGLLRKELETLIRTLHLEDSVKLKGRSNTIHEDISDAEFFVLSSDFEGLSNALLEAMMMGFPVISTDCEGSIDVIEHEKNGLMVHRGDETELFEAMLLYAENEEFREQLGREARRTAERFKREKVAEEWAELIEQRK